MRTLSLQLIFLLFSNLAFAQVGSKIDFFSQKFLGAKYSATGPLGEGLKPDTDPLIRFDAFDCTTYVETVMALSRASNPNDISAVTEILNQIRYENGVPKYDERNHFTSLQWIPENSSKGFLRDVTMELSASAQTLSTPINRGKWMKLQSQKDPEGFKDVVLPKDEITNSQLPVLPLKEFLLVDNNQKSLEENVLQQLIHVLSQKKNGIIINIIPFKRDLTPLIGTHLDITHQAFLILKNGVLYIRHASAGTEFVSEKPLVDYLFGRKDAVEFVNFLEVL